MELVTKSWATLESRDHTVYAVFPFGPVAEEVMLHGRSNNVYKNGETGTFTWAARMHFTRSQDGKVLIDKYTIIVVSLTWSGIKPHSVNTDHPRIPIPRSTRSFLGELINITSSL